MQLVAADVFAAELFGTAIEMLGEAAADRFGKVLAKIDADGPANHEPPG